MSHDETAAEVEALLERVASLTKTNAKLICEYTYSEALNKDLSEQVKNNTEHVNQLAFGNDNLTRINRKLQADLVNARIARDDLVLEVESLNKKLQRNNSIHFEERHLLEKELLHANKDIENYKLWFGIHSPTIIGPITPPKYRQSLPLGAPSTPEKVSLYLGGSKVKSIATATQLRLDKFNSENGTNLRADFDEQRRAMVDLEEFVEMQEAQEAANLQELSDTEDDTGSDFGTPTKPKPAPKQRPKKTVAKKQTAPARKATTTRSVAKPPKKVVFQYASDDSDCLVVEEPRPVGRRMGARAETQDGDNDEDEDSQSDNIQDYDDASIDESQQSAPDESWRVDCICKDEHDARHWVECNECGAWSHVECYGYDVNAVAEDDFVHLCPSCTDGQGTEDYEEYEATTKSKKRKGSVEHTGAAKKPRGNIWSENEKNQLAIAMGEHLERVKAGACEEIYDLKLFALLSEKLQKWRIDRSANACKIIWNRELRGSTGLDERRLKNPSKLATSVQ